METPGVHDRDNLAIGLFCPIVLARFSKTLYGQKWHTVTALSMQEMARKEQTATVVKRVVRMIVLFSRFLSVRRIWMLKISKMRLLCLLAAH